MKNFFLFALVAPFIFGATGCPNAFLESAKKTSDEALAFSAEQNANAGNWTSAIAAIQAMSSAGQAKRENKASLASYYAGRCGLNLLNFAQAVQTKMPAETLWPIMMSAEVGATSASLSDCVLGEQTLVSIDGTASRRTPDENVLLAFIEFAKMGAALEQSNADANHDGTVDGAFDACSSTAITDPAVQELGSGITLALQALNASGATVAGSVTTSVNQMCARVDTLLGTSGFCNKTSASDFTGSALLAVRSLIKSNEIGFNICGGNVGSSGACSCP